MVARRLPLVVLAVLLAGPLVHGALATNDDFRYHWGRRDSPFVLELGDNVQGSWDRYLAGSVKEWNRSDVVRSKVVRGSTSPSNCRPTEGRVEVCNGLYGWGENWLGITRIWFDNQDHIYQATVLFNDTYFKFDPDYNSGKVRRHTMCHELGHAFGLDHVGTSSCMNDDINRLEETLKPTNRDFKTLRQKYRHRDSANEVTLGRESRIGAEGADGTVDGGGFFEIETLPNTHTGPGGQHTRTVQELPDGGKVVTFTSWAD